jgi:hypothetical protein
MVMLKLNSNPISDGQLEKRKELEKKLQQDIEEYQMLVSTFSLTNDASKRISGMLTSFDNRLSKLEAYIMPIHSATESLTRTNKSIKKIM